MQFSHEARVTIEAPLRDVRSHWIDIHKLPCYLSHLRGTAPSEAEDDLVRLVIVLDGRHIEFPAQRTMCDENTICWQSLGRTFLYVLSVSLTPANDGTEVVVTVAYDPPGFLPDIAESLGLAKSFRRTLEADLRRYARSVRPERLPSFAMAD